MFAFVDHLSKQPPQAAVVPLPFVLLHPAMLAEKKVLDFAIGMDESLHAILESVTEHLLNTPGKMSYAPDIGRQLSKSMQAWLRKHNLRICSILTHYPNDFKIYKNGRGRRVECLRPTAAGVYSFEPSCPHVFHL
eukprot:TRINITY_DN3349_c0_g1_i3.p1 TRINITY_DN3349_c0_g1~~TRINITY_DN3349_c0_g1_i3.p1  ORF type:complete len:135 (+),score=29.65 TRINITY_DN3349_c0_g1_i3:119-523(+)